VAPGVAVAGVLLVWAMHWQGVDLATQLYRVNLFRQHGFVVWDTSWYGGHYVLPYSVLFPAFGAVLGLYGAAMVSAAAAAWAFERLLSRTSGPRNVVPAVVFAAGTVVPVAIGQLPFLAGEAAGLLALLAASRGRRRTAAVLALCCPLFSQVAGAFLVLALLAWALAVRGRPRLVCLTLMGVAALPLLALDVPFPEPGWFPFWGLDVVIILAICLIGAAVLPARYRALRIGLLLYGACSLLLFVVPTPLGGNFVRLGEAMAPAAIVAWSLTSRWRRFALILAVPLLLWQWTPAWSTINAGGDPSSSASYFAPLVSYLDRQPHAGRLEIPSMKNHWETAYVAPKVSLARGWERQVDIADNPLFYSSRFTPTAYHQWLDQTGVEWIAIPDAPLDYSAQQEAGLLRHPPSYLRLVWSDAHWRVWRVDGSPGLVSGPARLVSVRPQQLSLDVTGAGVVTIRERYTPGWGLIAGRGCLSGTEDGWTRLVTTAPGRVEVGFSLSAHHSDCDEAG
jgi:hypothetical protein